jgi:hypothetical protein
LYLTTDRSDFSLAGDDDLALKLDNKSNQNPKKYLFKLGRFLFTKADASLNFLNVSRGLADVFVKSLTAFDDAEFFIKLKKF